jgi:hypothetical protein
MGSDWPLMVMMHQPINAPVTSIENGEVGFNAIDIMIRLR